MHPRSTIVVYDDVSMLDRDMAEASRHFTTRRGTAAGTPLTTTTPTRRAEIQTAQASCPNPEIPRTASDSLMKRERTGFHSVPTRYRAFEPTIPR